MENTNHEKEVLYLLDEAAIKGPEGLLLKPIKWRIRDRAVTVLLGPAGAGKSILLRSLSGEALPEGCQRSGLWQYRDATLDETSQRALSGTEIVRSPQQKRGDLKNGKLERHENTSEPSWREALLSGAHTVLLDEPENGLQEDALASLKQMIRDQASRGAVILITHQLDFARAVADDICLICAQKIEAQGEASDFFQNPPSELATRFLEQGNCWPPPKTPDLPDHFQWVLPGRLAGMGKPGLLGDEEEDLTAIATAGVTNLITLTQERYPDQKLRSYGIVGRHFPIKDMGVPAIGTTASLCRDIKRLMEEGEGVAVHCHAGLGRTGTILASTLIWMGRGPDEAIEEIRIVRKGYIQSRAQLNFIQSFSDWQNPL